MIPEIKLCTTPDGEVTYLEWLPIEPQPCCNTCWYYGKTPGKRECDEATVSKNTFIPRCPDSFACNKYVSITDMKEHFKHCPNCDSENIKKVKDGIFNYKCLDCEYKWLLM